MQVLFFARLFNPHVGGVEKHISRISKSLSLKGHKVTVLTTRYEKNLSGREKKNGIEIIRFSQPKIKFLGLIYTWLWLLKNIELIRKSDIVHCHDVFIWYLPFRFLFPRKHVFTTFHGWEGKYPIPLKNIFLNRLASFLSTGTIAVGRYIEKYFGITADKITYGATEKFKLKHKFKKKKNYIIYVGRLEKDTGLPIILEVLNNFSRTDDGNKLVIEFLGDGKLREECEKYGKVHGFVDPKPFLAKAHVCFASGYLTILEAMANKCLVLCAYDNALKKDYYNLAPFKKWIISSDSALKIAKILKDFSRYESKYRKMIEEGYNWATNQTWEKLSNQYIALWGVRETY